ncbi:rhodanese-related sulfurtransferase [Halopolyspora algeriensis]|uniref:Rhodanese-related sulfurtransferase n=1 Tax=Halopolyspora algeriensis TaxID=1500506 RepID=A0A368VY05_9ACTN|nr:rhodanese-like domain-containing protein [Halopolyspora algeriensis]RCW44464.1 rhodanese-related sulfurtransferase [Halopolyspora algeriensis]TQM55825.1 rhodanese-related sulfurtransferase [Halopolyspora algeriensis]
MDPREVHEKQDQLQLVDVREPQEWQAGRIPGSQWIPMDELSARIGELDQQHRVVTICRSGKRSGEMAEFLNGRGYRADNLDGGIRAWAEQGLPVRTPDGEQPGKVA